MLNFDDIRIFNNLDSFSLNNISMLSPRMTALNNTFLKLKIKSTHDFRICGATALSLMDSDPIERINEMDYSSDIDVQLIDYEGNFWNEERLKCFGLDSRLSNEQLKYDIFCLKFLVEKYSLSIHTYTPLAFKRICSLKPNVLSVFRTVPSKEKYIYYGINCKNISISWESHKVHMGLSYIHNCNTIRNNDLYIDPYQHMAIVGINIIHNMETSMCIGSFLYEIAQFIKNKREGNVEDVILDLLSGPKMLPVMLRKCFREKLRFCTK